MELLHFIPAFVNKNVVEVNWINMTSIKLLSCREMCVMLYSHGADSLKYAQTVCTSIHTTFLLKLKGQESEWARPQLSVGNCLNITKMHAVWYILVRNMRYGFTEFSLVF